MALSSEASLGKWGRIACPTHMHRAGKPPAGIPHSGSCWLGFVGLCPPHLPAVASALTVSGPGQLSQEGRVGSLLLHRGVDDRSPPHPSIYSSFYPSIHLLSADLFNFYLLSIFLPQTENYNNRKLIKLITWTTALSN